MHCRNPRLNIPDPQPFFPSLTPSETETYGRAPEFGTQQLVQEANHTLILGIQRVIRSKEGKLQESGGLLRFSGAIVAFHVLGGRTVPSQILAHTIQH